MGAGLMRRRNSEGHRALIGTEGNGARLGIVCACATAFAFHFRVAAATSASSWALQSLRRFRAPGPFPVPGPRCAPAARTPYRLFPPPVPTSRRPTPPRHRSGFGGRAGPGGAAAAAAVAGGRAGGPQDVVHHAERAEQILAVRAPHPHHRRHPLLSEGQRGGSDRTGERWGSRTVPVNKGAEEGGCGEASCRPAAPRGGAGAELCSLTAAGPEGAARSGVRGD